MARCSIEDARVAQCAASDKPPQDKTPSSKTHGTAPAKVNIATSKQKLPITNPISNTTSSIIFDGITYYYSNPSQLPTTNVAITQSAQVETLSNSNNSDTCHLFHLYLALGGLPTASVDWSSISLI